MTTNQQVRARAAGELACRPGSVHPLARAGGHPSRAAVAGSLVRSTREHRAGRPRSLAQALCRSRGTALLTLLRVGFTEPPQSPAALVVSYTTVSPLPPGTARRRSVFCGTFPRVTPGRRYRPPCPAEPGPSSATPANRNRRGRPASSPAAPASLERAQPTVSASRRRIMRARAGWRKWRRVAGTPDIRQPAPRSECDIRCAITALNATFIRRPAQVRGRRVASARRCLPRPPESAGWSESEPAAAAVVQVGGVVEGPHQSRSVVEVVDPGQGGDVEVHPEHGLWRCEQGPADQGLDRRHVADQDSPLVPDAPRRAGRARRSRATPPSRSSRRLAARRRGWPARPSADPASARGPRRR